MRSVVMTAVGGPEVLKLAELPDPEIGGDHDVKVRLRAAGINPVDNKLRSGGTIGGTKIEARDQRSLSANGSLYVACARPTKFRCQVTTI